VALLDKTGQILEGARRRPAPRAVTANRWSLQVKRSLHGLSVIGNRAGHRDAHHLRYFGGVGMVPRAVPVQYQAQPWP
jgi:hypothetical protein